MIEVHVDPPPVHSDIDRAVSRMFRHVIADRYASLIASMFRVIPATPSLPAYSPESPEAILYVTKHVVDCGRTVEEALERWRRRRADAEVDAVCG